MTFPVFPGSNPSGYNLTRSLRFRSSASASLSRTFGTPTNNKIWTISVWAKRGNIGSRNFIAGTNTTGGTNAFYFDWDSDALEFGEYTSSWQWRLVTTQVFRDPSAWYHIVVAVDTTQATASNRVKMYVNGSQVTAFSTASYPTQNLNTYWNQSGQAARFGEMNGASLYYDGYLTEVNFIDGQALTPSSFGSTNTLTGVWQPARYTGTYGTNGFYLPFTDNSALTTSSNAGLGKDFSGNGNYWTTNNISITAGTTYDSMTDVPTLTSATAANFAVLNPIDASSNGTLSRANLQSTSVGVVSGKGSIAVSSGKWYWEVTCTGGDYSGVGSHIGIDSVTSPCTSAASARIGSTATSYSYNSWNGQKQNNNTSAAYGNTYTTNDVISIALDLDSGKIWWAKNGTWQASGDPSAGTNAAFSSITSGLYTAACGDDTGGGIVLNYNFGQRPFAYTPPTGFVALNTFNLPTSTIVKGNTVMDATTYTGNGGTQAVVNTSAFKPDLVWVKSRSSADSHVLYDSIRGVGQLKALSSDRTAAEGSVSDNSTYGYVNALNSNGFTVIAGSSGDFTNRSAYNYVGWQWQAGQGTTSSNTNGTITSTVSVNASAGFSVATFSNATSGSSFTFGHGLGVAPALVIFKYRNTTSDWYVYHQSTGNTGLTFLNTTGAFSANSTYLNNTSPSSSVVTIGSSFITGTAYNFVAYCWTPIAGYSAFGSYTGNGSTDGPFVYTGFRPRFILYKASNNVTNWVMLDTARDPYNVAGNYLFPNSSSAEANTPIFDIVSNGFKVRTAGGGTNGSGDNIVYMAFAENPFKNALAR